MSIHFLLSFPIIFSQVLGFDQLFAFILFHFNFLKKKNGYNRLAHVKYFSTINVSRFYNKCVLYIAWLELAGAHRRPTLIQLHFHKKEKGTWTWVAV